MIDYIIYWISSRFTLASGSGESPFNHYALRPKDAGHNA